jgi:type I restriction enzyme S subunit
MKKKWPSKRISEIATIKPPKSEARERVPPNALVSFLPMEDLGISTKYPEPKQTKRLSEVVGSYTYFADGDVLLAKITPCFENGKVGIAKDLENGVGFGSSEFFVLRPDCTVSNEWLFHFLSREDFRQEGALRMSGAVGHKRVPKEFLESCEIPVPSIPEQQRIVGVLDKAFEGLATAKANAEKNLQNARALFESHLQSVFTQRGKGWIEKRLGDVCDLQNGYAFKSSDYVGQSKTLNIRMSCIRPGGEFDSEHNQKFLPDKFAKDYAGFLLKEGDLIIAMTDMAGDPKILGVPTLVTNLNGRNFLMNQRVGKLFGFSEDLCIPYLRYFLATPSTKDFFKSKGAGGLQINISKSDILSVVIPIPSLSIQQAIVAQLDALVTHTQELRKLYEQKLAALEALKKSLLHQAFSGEL